MKKLWKLATAAGAMLTSAACIYMALILHSFKKHNIDFSKIMNQD